MLGLELLELVQQRVELGVGDLGVGVDVVALFVMADRVAKLARSRSAGVMSRAGRGSVRPPRPSDHRSREST